MSKLRSLMHSIENAKQSLDEAEAERDAFLGPILRALEATGGGIDSCDIEDSTVYIVRVGSTRGCSWSDSYDFPLSIFEAIDPIAAARDYITNLKHTAKVNRLAEKQAEFDKLKKELGQ